MRTHLFLLCVLHLMKEFGSAMIIKVSKDVTADNIFYLNIIAIIFGVPKSTLCSVACMKHGTNKVNFRRYEPEKSLCTCFHASNKFRDSRFRAPDIETTLYLVDCKLVVRLFRPFSFSNENALMILSFLALLLEKKISRESNTSVYS